MPIGLSPAAALKRIEGLAIRVVNRPLNAAMGQVYPAVAECERPVHVVYVLTDLARTSWRAEPAEGLDQAAKANKGKGVKIATFIWRLTPQEIENVPIVSAEPESSVVTQGEPVEIRARIRSQSRGGYEAPGRVRGRRGQEGREIDRAAQGPGEQEVVFTTSPRLEDGEVHPGKVKLSGTPDPFERDDERFFVFKLRPPLKVLLVSDIPYECGVCRGGARSRRARHRPADIVVESVLTDRFGQKKNDLKSYACVFVLNVKELDETEWGALNQYVHEGGGLVVAPGQRSHAGELQ